MGKKDGKHSNSEGDALFRAAVKDVEPLAARKRQSRASAATGSPRKRRKPEAVTHAENFAVNIEQLPMEPGEQLSFRRDSISTAIMRDLKRGRIPREDVLDLHGMTSDTAYSALSDFIDYARRRGYRCVRIVHGKGLGSGSRGAVLKAGVNHWLPRWDNVLAFCSAKPAEGGTGAIYLLLKTR